jgi:hypothetical protein
LIWIREGSIGNAVREVAISMERVKQSLVRIGLGAIITIWISILIAWNSGFLWMFAIDKFVTTIVLVGVMVFLTFQIIPKYINWHTQIDPKDADTEHILDEKVALAVSHLRARARRLRLVSMYTLALIVLVIISGIYLLRGEESLRAILADPQRANLLFDDKAELVEAINQDERRLAALSQDNQPDRVQDADTGRYREFPYVEFSLIPYRADTNEGRLTSCDGPCRATRIAVNKVRLADIDRRIEKLLAVPHDAPAANVPISSVVTKVISAVLLLILVQLLISLYRYNTRLAAFYDSRADVLLLVGAPSEGDAHILKTLIRLFSPDSLGFERVRVGPMSQILETIKRGTRT